MPGTHIPEAELERYALGQLNEDQEATVEEHILICNRCQDLLQEVDDLILAYRMAATRVPATEPSWFTRLASWLAAGLAPSRLSYAAASVLVLAASVAIYENGRVASSGASALIVVPAVRSLPSEIPAGTPVNLQLDVRGLEGLGTLSARVVDETRSVVWKGKVEVTGFHASASIPRLSKGDYVLRLYSTPAEQVAEYAVRVK
jgi:hypothetical protein